jgi:hypothetical protein
MTVLPDGDRASVWAESMRQGEALALTKADLRAAVNAIDGWADANAGAFNTAIPQPARSALSAKQKALLLMMVIRRRFEVT